MNTLVNTRRWNAMGVGTRLAVSTLALVALFVGVLVLTINTVVTHYFEARAVGHVHDQTELLAKLIDSTDKELHGKADFLAASFRGQLAGRIELGSQTVDVAGRATPELRVNGQVMNLDFALVDDYTRLTGAVATLFARTGDDFVRVTTSVKNEKGERAVGTLLAHEHPGYQAVLAGQSYTGLATLFGRSFMTRYDPLKDGAGRIVGLSFIGIDFSEHLASLKSAVRSLKIGQSGYFFVLDSRSGKTQGEVLVHPAIEGQNLLAQKDADGREFVKDMMAQPQGVIRYPWINAALGETAPREKVVAFLHYPAWNWLIAGGAYVDEYTQEVGRMRLLFAAMGLVFLLMISGMLFLMVRRLVTRPLNQARLAAEAIAQGDLSVTLDSPRRDEIGALMTSINDIGRGLSRVVHAVRQNSETLASACAQIAQGNEDLSARTESQASTLQETTSSMTALGATVQANARHAQQASQLADGASRVATEGGQVVSDVIGTMQGIDRASQRIADIIAVIDGISFQTNILALNAAVEAARAGEAGRGFAVVASEVRSLASRSADAAKEVRTLINDSVARVEHGTALVTQAGSTMTRIVESVGSVTTIMNEISAASAEQTDGVLQVGQSIAQIDHGTQQNAALVEEVAAAANSLQAQANELVRSVAVFKLEAHA